MGAVPEFTVNETGWSLTPPAGKDVTITVSGVGTIKLSGTIELTDGVIKLTGYGGAAAANALLMGIGTTASPATTASANKDFIELRTQSTATSGDSRCLYMRHDIAGIGGSGEALRAFTDLTAAAANAHGAHISVQAGSTGYVSGEALAVRGQLYLKNSVLPANGTYAAVQAEIFAENSTTDPSAATEVSFIRIVNNGGHSTGIGRTDDKAFMFVFSGFTSGAAKAWYDHQGTAPANVEEWLKIKTPGGTRWIPAYDAVV